MRAMRARRAGSLLLLVFRALAAAPGADALAAEAPAPSQVREIRYIGLSHVLPRDLEGVIPLVPGDFWKKSYFREIPSSIKAYYEKRGFFHADVSVELGGDGSLLSIKVSEGKPCLIKTLWVADPPQVKSKALRERFKNKIERLLKISAGDRYDEFLIAERLRELREWLVNENYVAAETDTVHLSFDEERASVDVVFAVNYGDQITFGFEGNTVFTKGDLNEFIAQSRNTDLGKDFVGVISRKIEEEYKAKAYGQAEVATRTIDLSGRKHVTFLIREGERTKIEDIRWEGLSPENAAPARKAFDSGASRLIQRGYYVERDFDKGIELVLEELKSRGYLSAKLVAKNVQPARARGRVRITAQISEGDQTQIGDVRIDGFSHLGRESALKELGTEPGKPFNPFRFEEGLQKIKAFYQKEGFLLARFSTPDDKIVSFSENNRTASIAIRFLEGPRMRIGEIRVRGLNKTREFVVTREIEVKPEDWWLGEKIDATEVNLKKLGLFSEVKTYPEPSDRGPAYRALVIDLKELDPGALEAGPGFRSDLGARAFARLSYNNLAGRNWIGVLSAEANRRLNEDYRFIEYELDSSFIEPRFFGTRNTYLVGLSTRKQSFPPNFNAVSTIFTTGFERKMAPELFKIKPLVTAKLLYRVERIRQFEVIVDGQEFPEDNRTLLIGSVIPSISVDTRDNPFTTTRGVLATVSFEYSHPHLTDQSVYKNEPNNEAPAYSKWTGSLHGYLPLPKDIVWSNVAAGGFIRSNVAAREIPLIKLFRLGGYSTLRGFKEDSINVDKNSIKGTLTYLNFRTQLDLPLVGELKLAPFLDAGNLYIDQVYNKPLRVGIGAGIHYLTPIGPINFDWGYKLDRANSETPGQFHFSVGLI